MAGTGHDPLPDDGSGPGPHPLVGRQTALIRALQVTTVAAWVLAAGGVVLPGEWGRRTAVALVVVLVAAPLARLLWLTVRWVRRGDPGFALLAGLLIAVSLSGVVIASL